MTHAERQAKRRQRKRAAGLAKLEIYAPKADHDAIRAYAKSLQHINQGDDK